MRNDPSSSLSALRAAEEEMAFLRDAWRGLAARHDPDEGRAARLYDQLTGLYSAGGRFYHNLRHVSELLRRLSDLRHLAADYDAVRFAAWFHDAVYDTRRADNEERSAGLAARALRELGVRDPTAARVREMILATKGHCAEGLTGDALLLLDADLSILGAPPETYEQYSRAIRLEYWWVEEPDYRRGRRAVLEGFLSRGRIYQTAEMAGRFEDRARRNIGREVESLS